MKTEVYQSPFEMCDVVLPVMITSYLTTGEFTNYNDKFREISDIEMNF